MPALAWAALIEVLTSWPRMPTFDAPPGADKLVHFGLYAVLATLTMRAAGARQSSARAVLAVALALLVWGLLDEWHQAFIPGRSADVADWAADAVGMIAGIGSRLWWVARGRARFA